MYPDAPRAARPHIGSIADLIDHQLGRYGDKPFLTWYDDDRGERVELSYRTFENWTAKVANLLVEEVGVGLGDRVATVLGDHWRGAAIAFACWRAGVCLVPVDVTAPAEAVAARLRASGCVVAFVGDWRLAEVAERLGPGPGRPALVAVAAALLGRPSGAGTAAPAGAEALDFSLVVPGMGDMFDGTGVSAAGDALLAGDGPGVRALTQEDLLAWAQATAAGLGLGQADRLRSGLPAHRALGTVTGLVTPFLAGAGVVVEQAFRPAAFWKRTADERVAVAALVAEQVEALLGDEAGAGPGPDPGRTRLRLVACDLDRVPGPLALAWERRFGVPLSPLPAPVPAGTGAR